MQREDSTKSAMTPARSTPQSSKSLFKLALFAFAVMFPGTLSAPVLREFVQEIYTIGADGAAWFLSVGMFGSILAAPFAGWASDRYGNRRRFIIIGALINAACWALLPYAPDFFIALGIRLIEGVSSVCMIGPFLAFAGDRNSVDESESGPDPASVYGWVGMSMMLGAGVGLAAGGLLGSVTPYAPFALAAVCMLTNAVFAHKIFPADSGVTRAPSRARSNTVARTAEWFFAQSSRGWTGALFLGLPLALAFVDRFSVGYLMTSLNFRMREDLLMNASAAGGVLGMIMILMSVLSPAAAGFVRRGGPGIITPVRAVVFGSALYGIGLALTGLAANARAMAGAALLAGLGAGCMHAPTMILTSRLAPPAFRATAMSAYIAAGSLGNLCGPVVSRHLEVVLENWAGPHGFALLAMSFGALEILLAILLFATILPGLLYGGDATNKDRAVA